MNRLVLAVLFLAVLAASLWLGLGRRAAHATRVAGLETSAEAGSDSAGVQPAAEASASRELEALGPTVLPSERNLPAALETLVLRAADDEPVEGVEILARGESDGERIELGGRTDAGGLCRLEHATAFVAGSAQVRPTATTSGEWRSLDRAWVEEGTMLPITVRVSGGGTLAGRVVDGAGKPVAGARVLGWCSGRYEPTRPPERQTVSGEDGRFEIAHLGAEFRLVAEKEGLGCSQGLKGELAPGAIAEGELELVLRPLRTVRGRVLGEHGEPLQAGLTLQEVGFGGSHDDTGVIGVRRMRPVEGQAGCDARGAFELGPLPRGTWSVRFEEPEHLLVRMRMPAEDGEWLVRLPAGCGVRGSVLDADGRPVAGARVALRSLEDDDGWTMVPDGPQVLTLSWREARSTRDGGFVVGGAECGKGAILTVSAPGHAPWVHEESELQPGAKRSVEARLEPGLPLAGRVIEADGSPVVGATVVLEGERAYERGSDSDVPATWEHLFDRGRTHTDGTGRFRFEDLYAGRFQVRVHLPGEGPLHQDAVGYAGEEALEIVLDRAAIERVVLVGHVVDRRTGEPVRAFTLTPMVWEGSSARGSAIEVSDGGGRFRVAGLEPGRIALNVHAPGYATWRDEPRDLAVGEQRYDVRLSELRSIEIRLLQSDGHPYPRRASARFSRPTGEEVWVQSNHSSTSRISLNGGVAKGLQLPAELLQVAFELHDGEPELVFDLDLERDPSEVFEFRVERVDSEPIQVGSLVYSAAASYDATGLEEELRAKQGLIERPECGPPTVRVTMIARNARGVALLVGSLEPVDGGFLERWAWPGQGQSSQARPPYPMFHTSVPGRVTTLVFEADGHEPLELALDPEADNGGLPAILVLRRE